MSVLDSRGEVARSMRDLADLLCELYAKKHFRLRPEMAMLFNLNMCSAMSKKKGPAGETEGVTNLLCEAVHGTPHPIPSPARKCHRRKLCHAQFQAVPDLTDAAVRLTTLAWLCNTI